MREVRRNRHDRGFAIVMVLFVIGLLLVLGAALTMTSVMNSQNTVSADGRQRAYNTAESGVADVMTALGNETITSSTTGWVNGNSFPSQTDSNASYDYQVIFNNSQTNLAAATDPLTNTGQTCSSTTTQSFGCVVIPTLGALIAVRGHYGSHTMNAEVIAQSNQFSLNGNTLLTKGDAGTNGNGDIVSDPGYGGLPSGVPASHNVKAYTDGSFNGGKGLIDGEVTSVGTATATLPAGCAWCIATSNASAVAFPSSNSLSQQENQWKNAAIAQGHYYSSSATLPSSIDVTNTWPNPQIWFIDQGIDLKSLPITNEGGIVVVTGAITETGNKSAANYTLSDNCNKSCTCHEQSQLIDLSTSGLAIHGQGTGKGHNVSQGVLFAPSGPATNIGNATMQAAVVAASAQIGGTATLTADTCAAQASIPIPGYNLVGYGEH